MFPKKPTITAQDPDEINPSEVGTSKRSVSEILSEASTGNHSNVIIPKSTQISEEIVGKIIATFSDAFGLSYITGTIAIYLLFLNGAANKGAPESLTVTVKDSVGINTVCDKFTLIYAYRLHTKNIYLRRLAETLSTQISKFAEHYSFEGDLCKQINNRLKSKNETPLSIKEKSWCSSFNQNNRFMEQDQDLKRVNSLLASDLTIKFESKAPKPKSVTKPKKNKPSPKKPGQGKKPKGGSRPKK